MTPLISEIEELGQIKTFAKDEYLFSAGDKALGFYYVIRGQIRVYHLDEEAKEVEVARFGPGDILGEAVVFGGEVYPVFAAAIKNSKVLYFSKRTVLDSLDNRKISAFFIQLLAQKCIVLNQRIESLFLKTVRQRLIQYLLSKCAGQGKYTIVLDIKKVELARYLGTISETMSRNLHDLQAEGLITVKGKTIVIHDSVKMHQAG
ncbi:MAG: Crp/Fnr family transcriptional regulator [Candidatus Margulisiibacteriota bacterium]|jgi:CRP/FNR family transcriptional regulator